MNLQNQFLESECVEQPINSLISSSFLLSFHPPFPLSFPVPPPLVSRQLITKKGSLSRDRWRVNVPLNEIFADFVKSSDFTRGSLADWEEADGEYQPQPLHLETRVYHVRYTFLADCFRDSNWERLEIKRGYIFAAKVANGERFERYCPFQIKLNPKAKKWITPSVQNTWQINDYRRGQYIRGYSKNLDSRLVRLIKANTKVTAYYLWNYLGNWILA